MQTYTIKKTTFHTGTELGAQGQCSKKNVFNKI